MYTLATPALPPALALYGLVVRMNHVLLITQNYYYQQKKSKQSVHCVMRIANVNAPFLRR